MQDAAFDLLEKFTYEGGELVDVEGVVGPQTGATKLAELIAKRVSEMTRNPCFSVSPAKHEEAGVKSMVFTPEEEVKLRGKTVLLCEDVLTTGGSVELTASAVAQANGCALGYVLVLVNRSGLKEVYGRKVLPLIDRPMPMWTPEECPLCPKGSEALPPKGDNWPRFTAQY
jgi:orotate phosphoribosyltransferase